MVESRKGCPPWTQPLSDMMKNSGTKASIAIMSERAQISGWLKLFRPPNLFSVPGDPLAGFLLAGGAATSPSIWLACASSVFAYLYGLAANDIADFEEDSKERPTRPLPSGEVSVGGAQTAAAFMALLSAAAAALAGTAPLLVALALLGVISLYNFSKAVRKSMGPAALGLCRALSIILGAVAASPCALELPLAAALGSFIYVMGLSIAAKGETERMDARPGRAMFLLGAGAWGCVAVAAAAWHCVPRPSYADATCLIVSIVAADIFARRALAQFRAFGVPTEPAQVQSGIGALIGGLIFAQAATCAAAGSILFSVALLLAAPLAKLSARKFYGS